jgi:membrane protease YdiL (CAAX protease family)
MKDKLPGPSAAFGLFLLAALLNVVFSLILFSISEDLGVVVSEPLAILIPTLLLVRFLRLDAGKTLRLKLPSAMDLLLALPLAFSLTVLTDQLSNLTSQVYPLPEQFQEGMIRLLRAENAYDWVIRVLGIGLGAAVSEELLFRGFIQKGLERGLGRSAGVLLTAVLFALMHLIPQGILSYVFAGIVLGTIALATESILIPMVVHFIYNVSAVALLSLYDVETLGRPVWIPPGILIPALLIFGLTFGYFVRKAAEAPSPQQPSLPLAPPAPPDSMDVTPAPLGLAAVAPQRRRLGWLVVGCAAAGGTLLILSLFSYTVYQAHSPTILASMVETMQQDVLRSLSPGASSRAAGVEEEFDALAEVARNGRLGLMQLGRLNWTLAKARSDGLVSMEEIDAIVEEIRSLVRGGTPVRRL